MTKTMTKAEVDEFIREDEEFADMGESPVCYCDFCGRPIYAGHEMLVAITADNEEVIRTCDYCSNGRVGGPSIEEYLDVLGIWNYKGDAEDADMIASERRRRIVNGRIKV